MWNYSQKKRVQRIRNMWRYNGQEISKIKDYNNQRFKKFREPQARIKQANTYT